MTTNSRQYDRISNRRFFIDLFRAFGGALFFSLPMLMTMEMWELGFHMDRLRLALFLLMAIPVLSALSYHAGFEETFSCREDLQDAFIAFAVGFTTAGIMLSLFGIIKTGMPLNEIIGKVGIQAFPGGVGAMLARTQLSSAKVELREPKGGPRYLGEIFLMAVGALFLGLNLAPTEEMILISYTMSIWHVVSLAVVSIALLHAFVYVVEFRGHADVPEGTSLSNIFLRFTVVGYAVALLISLYILWTFGRTDGTSFREVIESMVVLGFPAALGAAAARLVL